MRPFAAQAEEHANSSKTAGSATAAEVEAEPQEPRQPLAAQTEEPANPSESAGRTTLEPLEEPRASQDKASSLKQCAAMAAQEPQPLTEGIGGHKQSLQKALHKASAGGSAEAVRLLVERAPDSAAALVACDKHGNTPLHTACQSGNVEAVKALAELGSSATANNDGFSPFHLAVRSGHAEAVQLLFDRSPGSAASLAAKDERGWTLLHEAAISGHAASIQLLFDLAPAVAAASLQARASNGFRPLQFAAKAGHAEAIHALLEQAPDRVTALASTSRGKTALEWAVDSHKDKAANLLRQMGAR
jgi:ankyrin repeat protein